MSNRRIWVAESNIFRPLFFPRAAGLVSVMMLRILHALKAKSIVNVSSVSRFNVRMAECISPLIQLGVNRDLITATAVIAGLGSIMFGFLTNLPVALAYVLGNYNLLRIANSDQSWHGIECLLHISSGWLSWHWQCFLSTGTHCRLCRRLRLRLSLIDWYEAMASKSDSQLRQGCKRRRDRSFPDGDRPLVFGRNRCYHWICGHSDRSGRVPARISRQYWSLHWPQVGKSYCKPTFLSIGISN